LIRKTRILADKMPSPLLQKFNKGLKAAMPFLAVIVVLVSAGYVSWLNHNDFEKAIIRQTQTQLLITALSEAKIIEKNIYDIGSSPTGINQLVKNIDDLEKVYTIVVTDNGKIISCPYASFLGINILEFTNNKIPESDWEKLNSVIHEFKNGKSGTAILDFLSEDPSHKIVKTIIAFSPMRVGKNRNAIIIVMEYSLIANLIHRNLRDNLLFMVLTNFVIAIFGLALFRIHREKDKLAISEAALNIINRQLHSEIDDRKKSGKK